MDSAMGSGASSAALGSSLAFASEDELRSICATLPDDVREKIDKSLDGGYAGKSVACSSVDLAQIKGLRDATKAGAGVYWDFATKQAKLGRTWHQNAPPYVRADLCRDCTEDELKSCRDRARIDEIQPACEGTSPQVLIIIGPSGAGKSVALPKAAEIFGLDLKQFARVDGDDMRSAHTAWKKLVAEEKGNGYLDAYDIYITNKGNKDLKKKYSKECLNAKKNVIFPWTSIDAGALDLIKKNGYVVHILGLLISCAESDCRQKNRAEMNGRWADTPADKWQHTVEHMSKLCLAETSHKVMIYETTDVMNMRVVHTRGIHGVEDPDDLQATIERLKLDMTI